MTEHAPGAILQGEGELELNADRPAVQATVTNAGDRAIQVGSHFHFFEANSSLRFDREAAFGLRLDIPSGTAVRFEAGQTHVVSLVPFGGARRILGANNLTDAASREDSIKRARDRGFIQ